MIPFVTRDVINDTQNIGYGNPKEIIAELKDDNPHLISYIIESAKHVSKAEPSIAFVTGALIMYELIAAQMQVDKKKYGDNT